MTYHYAIAQQHLDIHRNCYMLDKKEDDKKSFYWYYNEIIFVLKSFRPQPDIIFSLSSRSPFSIEIIIAFVEYLI